MSNALLRVLTALVGIPLMVFLLYLGGWYFGGAVVAAALLGQHEIYRMMEAATLGPMKTAGLAIGALVAVSPLWAPALPLALFLTVLLLAYSPFASFERPLPSLSGTLFGVLYPTALFASLIVLRQARGPAVGDGEAFYLTLSIFLFVWASDTSAYYVGKNLGKHPLAPLISPKKTWEGTIGGVVGAVLAAVALKFSLLAFLAWPHVLALAFFGGGVGQVGDLAESRLKRSVNIKDSGTLLPGHGGLLDRFDAVYLAAPLAYLYLRYVAGIFS